MNTEISTKCEVLKGKLTSEYVVMIKTFDDVLWKGTVNKEKVFELEAVVNDYEPTKGRIYAFLISHDQASALIELPVDSSARDRRIVVPVDTIWPPPQKSGDF